MQVSFHLMLTHKSLKLCSLSKNSFFCCFFCSFGMNFTVMSSSSLSVSCFHLVCRWTLFAFFSVYLLYSSVLWRLFLSYIFCLFVEVLAVFIHTSLSLVSIFMTIILNSLSGKLVISISIRFFSWGLACFFHLEPIFLSPHFAQVPVFLCIRWENSCVSWSCSSGIV